MVSAVGALSSLFSFASLILVAIAIGTNYWVRVENPRVEGTSNLNPPVLNEAFSVTYDLDYMGLWVGCHRALEFGNLNKISCGYIGSSCYSNICWIRNGIEERCRDTRVEAIENCSAYQASRAMTIIGTIFLVLGASLQAVSVCRSSRGTTLIGSVLTFLAFLFLMIGFAVFHRNVFVNGPLDDIGHIGWSFVLFIIAWPLAFLAAILGLLASFNAAKQASDFEESE